MIDERTRLFTERMGKIVAKNKAKRKLEKEIRKEVRQNQIESNNDKFKKMFK